MPRNVTLLFALLIAALMNPASSAAQITMEDMLLRLDGLQTAYSRKYVSASEMGFASPEAQDPTVPSLVLVTVLEFETEEHVADAFDGVLNGLVAKLIIGEPDMDIDATTIDDLGDQAELFSGSYETYDGSTEHGALLALQDGNLGFLITAYGLDSAITDTMTDIAGFMVDAEPGTDPVTPQFPAATTGGSFDVMPAADDADVVHGLVPMYDYDLLLNGGTEPIDHMEDDMHDHLHDEATPTSHVRDERASANAA